MSKRSFSRDPSEIEQLTTEAVSLAKERRRRELTEDELSGVQGGLIGTTTILTGYAPVPRGQTFPL